MSFVNAALWSVWAAMTVGAVGYVLHFGRNCPILDEWGMLAALSGEQDLLEFLSQRHCEHRYPLPRLLFHFLFQTTGDLRSGMLASVFFLSGSAAILMTVAKRVRGRSSFADLFFPVSFLHWGHWENLTMGYQVAFTLPCFLAACSIGLGTSHCSSDRLLVRRAAMLTVTGLLLEGCGSAGLCFAAGIGFWLLWATGCAIRNEAIRLAMTAGLGAVAVAAVALMLIALLPPRSNPGFVPRPIDYARFAARLSATSFCPAHATSWKVDALAASAACMAGLLSLRQAWRMQCGLAGGAAIGLMGGTALFLGLTWGRVVCGVEAATLSRYSVVLVPGVAASFLCTLAAGGVARRFVPAMIAFVAIAALPANVSLGIHRGTRLAGRCDAVEADLRDGLPSGLIAERYKWEVMLCSPEQSAACFSNCKRIGLEPFRDFQPTLHTSIQTLPFQREACQIMVTPGKGTMAIIIHGEFTPSIAAFMDLRVRWRDGPSGDWREETFRAACCEAHTIVIRASDETDRVEVVPESRFNYHITKVERLVRP